MTYGARDRHRRSQADRTGSYGRWWYTSTELYIVVYSHFQLLLSSSTLQLECHLCMNIILLLFRRQIEVLCICRRWLLLAREGWVTFSSTPAEVCSIDSLLKPWPRCSACACENRRKIEVSINRSTFSAEQRRRAQRVVDSSHRNHRPSITMPLIRFPAVVPSSGRSRRPARHKTHNRSQLTCFSVTNSIENCPVHLANLRGRLGRLHGSLTLSGGPVGPLARWAAMSNVEGGSGAKKGPRGF